MMRFLGNNVAKVISKNIVFVLFVSKILSPLLVIEIEGTNLQICRLQNRNISSASKTGLSYICIAISLLRSNFVFVDISDSFCFNQIYSCDCHHRRCP